MTRTKTLLDQLNDRMRGMRAWGESRHAGKADGTAAGKIYSYDTYTAYWKVGKSFVRWCRQEYRIKKLDDCRGRADEYLAKMRDDGCSAWTMGQARSALRKIFQDGEIGKGIEVRQRRSDVTRSRLEVKRDSHFSERRNADLVAFCRATGLRRHELEGLDRDHPTRIDPETGDMYLVGIRGKGGRVRDVLVLDREIVQRKLDGGEGRAFGKVHSAADVHGYRAEYAAAVYRMNAREPGEVPRRERYCCRGDRAGVWYDKRAMKVVSENLGHSRISVIAESYLWTL